MAKTKVAPTTQKQINIADIKDGIILTKTGSLKAVIEVQPINFALASEQDQQALVGGYQNFINSLSFPIQILVQSRRLDLFPYLSQLEKTVQEIDSDLLRLHGSEYIEFLRRLTQLANIMQKRFFVVISYNPAPVKKISLAGQIFGFGQTKTLTFKPAEFAKWRQLLQERIEVVKSGLAPLGIGSSLLKTQQTIELFYSTFNPEEAVEERLVKTDQISTAIIHKGPAGQTLASQ